MSLSVNTQNRITNSGFRYDSAGNTTADGTYTYTWDAENHVKTAAGVTYTYDGSGQRVKKSNGKLYWYSGGAILTETDLSGNTLNEYIYFGGARIARRDGSGNVYYYFADHLGSSRVMTNATGTVCYEADFYPFGGERVITGSCSQNYKFAGMEQDAETGLNHTLFRQQSSSLGRWLSPDPLAGNIFNPQSLNRYAYVLNNPCNRVDPLGLSECSFYITIAIDIPLNKTGNDPTFRQVGLAQVEARRILEAAGLGVLFNQSKPDFTLTLKSGVLWYESGVSSDTYARNNTFGWSPINSANAYLDHIIRDYGEGYGLVLGRVLDHEFGHWALQLVHNMLEAGPGEQGIMSQGDLKPLTPLDGTFTGLGQVPRLQELCKQLHPQTQGRSRSSPASPSGGGNGPLPGERAGAGPGNPPYGVDGSAGGRPANIGICIETSTGMFCW